MIAGQKQPVQYYCMFIEHLLGHLIILAHSDPLRDCPGKGNSPYFTKKFWESIYKCLIVYFARSFARGEIDAPFMMIIHCHLPLLTIMNRYEPLLTI